MGFARTERILYVEDDEDIREMMASFLAGEGYSVASFRTAEEGLAALESKGCDLLLTDYVLPGENAAWLIETATSRHLLDDIPVIVVSAEYKPDGVSGHRFLRKPVAMNTLLQGIVEALESRVAKASARPSPVPDQAKIELVLYISTPSHEADAARRNLTRILRALGPERANVVVVDIAKDGDRALQAIEEDRIVVLPTLVRRAPGPKLWIAGDLSKREYVRSVLQADGGAPPSADES